MAEETLRYRVEIDQADLATQLSTIKNQIDTALGSMAFNDIGQAPPMDPIVGGIANFAETAMAASSNFQQSIYDARNIFTNSFESGRLGFQKFREDMYTAGLVSPPAYAHAAPSLQVAQWGGVIPGLEEAGAVKSFMAGQFGYGYDRNMPVARGTYMREMEQRFKDQIGDKVSGAAGWAALGMAFIPGMQAAGVTLGMGTLAAEIPGLLDLESTAAENFGSFIQQASWRNAGGAYTKNEAVSAATSIRRLAENPNIRATVGDATDVENVVAEFASMGGFLDTTNVEQFKQRAKETVENFRKVQYAIQGSTEDALQVMADVMQTGMAGSAAGAANLIQTASSVGGSIGYTSQEMLQYARGGAEMVRGTAVSMERGATDAMYTLARVRSGGFDPTLINMMGGSEQASHFLQSTAYNFANTPTGRLMNAAEVGGLYGGAGSISDIFSSAGRALGGTAEDALDLVVKMNKSLETTSSSEQLSRMARADFEVMSSLGIGVTQDRYAAYLTQRGYSYGQANMLAANAFQLPESYGEALYNEAESRILSGEDQRLSAREIRRSRRKAGRSRWYRENISNPMGYLSDAISEDMSAGLEFIFGEDEESEVGRGAMQARGEIAGGNVSLAAALAAGDMFSTKESRAWERNYEQNKRWRDNNLTVRWADRKAFHGTFVGASGSVARAIAMSSEQRPESNDMLSEYIKSVESLEEVGLSVNGNQTFSEMQDLITNTEGLTTEQLNAVNAFKERWGSNMFSLKRDLINRKTETSYDNIINKKGGLKDTLAQIEKDSRSYTIKNEVGAEETVYNNAGVARSRQIANSAGASKDIQNLFMFGMKDIEEGGYGSLEAAIERLESDEVQNLSSKKEYTTGLNQKLAELKALRDSDAYGEYKNVQTAAANQTGRSYIDSMYATFSKYDKNTSYEEFSKTWTPYWSMIGSELMGANPTAEREKKVLEDISGAMKSTDAAAALEEKYPEAFKKARESTDETLLTGAGEERNMNSVIENNTAVMQQILKTLQARGSYGGAW